MKEVYEKDELTIDIIKTIEVVKKKKGEKYKNGLYILTEVVRVLNEKGLKITVEDLTDSKILKPRIDTATGHEVNGKKVKRRKVTQAVAIPYDEKIAIIEQITHKIKGDELTRELSLYEKADYIENEIYDETGHLLPRNLKGYNKKVLKLRSKVNREL